MPTVYQLKQYLQIDSTDKDDLLQFCLDTAYQKIAQFFGGELARGRYVETFRWKKLILPKHYPIAKVHKVAINGVELVQNLDYFWGSWDIELFAGKEGDVVEVDYEAGFEVLPEDLELAILLQASNVLKMSAELMPQQLIDTRLTREVGELLRPYLRVGF